LTAASASAKPAWSKSASDSSIGEDRTTEAALEAAAMTGHRGPVAAAGLWVAH
jgi:hypothetical protein